jgi:lysophospholipase L1-like esterase
LTTTLTTGPAGSISHDHTWRQRLRRRLGRAVGQLAAPLIRPQQEHRRSQFNALGCPSGRIVFLGDSITEQCLWNEWFPELPVLNRGIGGETSGQVLDRLDSAINEPLAVFLLIGTNDLSVGFAEDEIVQNVRDTLREIARRAEDCPVYVQSVMPRTAAYRDRISRLNERLELLCETDFPSSRYIDLWPALATPEGTLRPDYSLDKLHLNAAGYRSWVERIRPHVVMHSQAAKPGS